MPAPGPNDATPALRTPMPRLVDPACAEHPAIDWSAPIATNRARQVCEGCPALEPCRSWAIKEPLARGILGGLSEAERDRMRGGPGVCGYLGADDYDPDPCRMPAIYRGYCKRHYQRIRYHENPGTRLSYYQRRKAGLT